MERSMVTSLGSDIARKAKILGFFLNAASLSEKIYCSIDGICNGVYIPRIAPAQKDGTLDYRPIEKFDHSGLNVNVKTKSASICLSVGHGNSPMVIKFIALLSIYTIYKGMRLHKVLTNYPNNEACNEAIWWRPGITYGPPGNRKNKTRWVTINPPSFISPTESYLGYQVDTRFPNYIQTWTLVPNDRNDFIRWLHSNLSMNSEIVEQDAYQGFSAIDEQTQACVQVQALKPRNKTGPQPKTRWSH